MMVQFFFFSLFFDWPWEKTSSNSVSPKSHRCTLHSTPSGQHGAYPSAGQWDVHGSTEIHYALNVDTGFPGGARGKDGTCQTRRHERCRLTSLRREDPLEKGMATTPLFLPENPMDRGARLAPVRCDWSDWAHTVNMGICPTRLFHGKAVMFIRQSFPWNESNFLKRWI